MLSVDERLSLIERRVARLEVVFVRSEYSVTKRELQVLRLIVREMTTKEIAAKLKVSLKTAETHRASLMRKLDVHNVVGLVKFAIKNSLT